jgi:phosphoethanolamine N-methyltransferase
VLDLGCGVGGAAILMAGDMGAARVCGADVEAEALARAAVTVRAAGLEGAVELRRIEPGPLPFADACFDVAYSNDVICHIADKTVLFAEILRVLRPGGVFAFGDWVVGEAVKHGTPERAIFDDWAGQLHAGGLRFFFEPASAYQAALGDAGFSRVETRDNSAWAEGIARAQLAHGEGPGRQAAIEELGEAAYQRRLSLTRARWEALRRGAAGHSLPRAWKAARR